MRSEINPEIARRRIERPLPLLDQVSSAPSASTAQAATAGMGAVTPSMAPEESGLSTPALPSAQCETGAASDCSSGKAFTAPEIARARRGDPKTSKAAAASVKNVVPIREEILLVLRHLGPRTDEQIIHTIRKWGVVKATDAGIRTRRSELVTMGFVEACEELGKTASGRDCQRWRLKK